MPVITVEGPPIFDPAVRRSLVEELTEAAASAYGMPKEKFVILLRENSPEQVAVGGTLIADQK